MHSPRIGLMRHLRVDMPMPSGWLNARDLTVWRERYDVCELAPGSSIDAGNIEWQRCISSDLPRALQTARQAFAGDIEVTPLLREPNVAEFGTGSLRLPEGAWRWILRGAWLSGHSSQRAARDDFMSRMRRVADELLASDRDILVVSHAGVMMFLRRLLIGAGYDGPAFREADHGKVYVFGKR